MAPWCYIPPTPSIVTSTPPCAAFWMKESFRIHVAFGDGYPERVGFLKVFFRWHGSDLFWTWFFKVKVVDSVGNWSLGRCNFYSFVSQASGRNFISVVYGYPCIPSVYYGHEIYIRDYTRSQKAVVGNIWKTTPRIVRLYLGLWFGFWF